MKHYLTRKEVAQHYPISVSELAQLASRGTGPRFFKPTAKALYLEEDVEFWIEKHVVPFEKKSRSGGIIRGKKIPARVKSQDVADTNSVVRKAGRHRKSLVPTADSSLRRDKDTVN